MDNIHEGHRERLKDRFLITKFEGFQPHEILELLLFYGVPRTDTNNLAHRLLDEFGSIANIFNAPYESLVKFNGLTKNSALLLKIIPPLAGYYSQSSIEDYSLDTTTKICKYCSTLFIDALVEQLRVICLDDKLKIISSGVVIEGDPSSLQINVRKIVEFTYRSSCDTIIIAHNHPNGVPRVSKPDIAATTMLNDALRSVGITLLDHVIVNKTAAMSMYESGYFSVFK